MSGPLSITLTHRTCGERLAPDLSCGTCSRTFKRPAVTFSALIQPQD
ncbi:hypothetical protein [Actinomadura sp. 6N118]